MTSPPVHNARLDAGLRHTFGLDVDEDSWLQRLKGVDARWELGRLGEYELLAEAGRGGQGVVYRARQPRTARVIALKKLFAGAIHSDLSRARFEREVELAAALDHPHIVTVFGSEVVGDQPLLAMQWIDGIPIDRWSAGEVGGRPAQADLLRVFLQVCDGIQHAHQRGVIHRDIKPSNILIDRAGDAHVLDFGLAKLHRDNVDNSSLTLTGAFLGTLAYAAPEQTEGDSRRVDARTDVYALGAVLYRILTGSQPLELSGGLTEYFNVIRHVDPAAPSTHDRTIHRELDLIVLKALAKDKEQRYPSVDALASDVNRFVRGEPISAHPPGRAYRLRKFARMHRAAVSAAAILLIVLIGAAATSTVFYLRAGRALRSESAQRQAAERLRQAAEDEAEKQRALSEVLQHMLAGADPAQQQGDPDVTVREALNAYVQLLDSRQETYSLPVEAAVRRALAETYFALGLFEQALPLNIASVELFRSAGNAGRELVESLRQLSMTLRSRAQFADAEAAVREALAIADTLPEEDQAIKAGLLTELATIEHSKPDGRAKAEALHREALARFRELHGDASEDVARSLNNLSLVLTNPRESIEMARKALAIRRKLPGDHRIEIAKASANLGMFLRHAGDFAASLESYDDAVGVLTSLRGAAHPDTLLVRRNRARVQHELGNIEEARREFRDIAAAREAALGPDSPLVADNLFGVGMMSLALGCSEDAQTALERTLSILQRQEQRDTSFEPYVQTQLAIALCGLGRLDEAETTCDRALEWSRATLGVNLMTAHALNVRGTILTARGCHEEAERVLTECVAMTRGLGASGRSVLGAHLLSLGELRLKQNQPAEAEPLLREALGLIEAQPPDRHHRLILARLSLIEALLAKHALSEAESHLQIVDDALLSEMQSPSRCAVQHVPRLIALYERCATADPARSFGDQAREWHQRATTPAVDSDDPMAGS